MSFTSQPTPTRSTHPFIVATLVVIAVSLAFIGGVFIFGGSDDAPRPATTGTTAPAAAPATPEETSAPSLTEPEALDLAHAEVRRDPNDGQAKGSVDAPVVMVVYSDFACPFCTHLAQEIDPELEDLVEDGTLRVEWRDMAVVTESSPLAAQAGVAAANQGRFWEFHDAVYAAADPNGHPEYTEESLIGFAEAAGVPDIEQFTADMNDPATAQAVTDAATHAQGIGITGTPFLIINDAAINGYRPAEYVRATVLEQAALVQ